MELLGFKGISEEEERIISDLINECRSININTKIKKEAIHIRKVSGLKLPDSFIAATSSYLQIPLISADSDFKKLENINLVHYEKE